jgi:hypothetical protein
LKINKKDNIGIIEDSQPQHDAVALCQICMAKFSMRVPLGPRLDYTERDADKWRQCPHCRRIFPIYEIRHEGKLVGLLEPEENPFKSTGDITGLDNKGFDKTARKRKEIKERIKNERDPEIRALLKQGFDVTFHDGDTVDV